MTGLVFKYRMFVQARTDLTEDEIRQYLATKKNGVSPNNWPWRETNDFVYARRMNNAKAFYMALKGIKKPYKVKAQKVAEERPGGRSDVEAMRAWRGFAGVTGAIGEAADEVRHFSTDGSGQTACGLALSHWWWSVGKPECPICLAAAVEKHPEMKEFL